LGGDPGPRQSGGKTGKKDVASPVVAGERFPGAGTRPGDGHPPGGRGRTGIYLASGAQGAWDGPGSHKEGAKKGGQGFLGLRGVVSGGRGGDKQKVWGAVRGRGRGAVGAPKGF